MFPLMKRRLRAAFAGIILTGTAVAATTDTATIVDSGSTNRAGFSITVDRSGNAEVNVRPRRFGALAERGTGQAAAPPKPVQRTLPKNLVETFYADLKAAGPLGSLPAVHCAKSASFGSTLTVTLGDEQSPDLSCGDGGNAAVRDLIGVVRQIVALANAQDMRLQREVK
jgi:hypothetical protein